MLFGRYVNQIAQRINRAWVRPGIDGSQAFKCRAQIVQSRAGTVLEVTLVSCDSSPDWQQSLVNAIQAASPLPAPASTSVFTRSLVLDFTSAALPDGSPLRTASAGSRP